MDVTAESIIDLWEKRESICGLEITYEPEHVRFFRARFKPSGATRVLNDEPYVEAQLQVSDAHA